MEENNLEAARDMRKIVLYIAMSLDGYIADANGGVSWLRGQDSDSESEGSYPEFVRDIDTVVMGWETYYQVITELSPDGMIDRFYISVIPVLLGAGVRLFGELPEEQELRLMETKSYNGIVELRYEKR